MESILDIYQNHPANYILASNGGYGKSTQLKYFQKELLGKEIICPDRKCVCIPIYIKMAQINREWSSVDDAYLYKYLLKHYFNYIDQDNIEKVKKMLTDKKYKFVFLLDGINEIIHYGNVYEALANSIGELLCNEEYLDTVNFIITTRAEKTQSRVTILDGKVSDAYFYFLYIKDLDKSTITGYLGNHKYNVVLDKILVNPMMLRMYRTLKEVIPDYEFTQCSQLIEAYLMLDKEQKRMGIFADAHTDLRKKVIDIVIPYIAFKIELCYLKSEEVSKLNIDVLLSFLANQGVVKRDECNKMIEILDMMHIISDMDFSHQIFRDYFAAKGFLLQLSEKESVEFIQALNKYLYYDDSMGVELERRTQYLDLAEFIYADIQNQLDLHLARVLPRGTEKSLQIAQSFYQELAGVYDDLKDRGLSHEIAWISYSVLMKITEIPAFERAKKLNTLFYCIINEKGNYMIGDSEIEPLQLIDTAEEYFNEEHEDNYIFDGKLKCKLLSNRGAYYTSRSVDEKNYHEALNWHLKSLEERKKYDSRNLIRSYRTIMGDYYYLGEYMKAFKAYEDGISCKTKHKIPSDIYHEDLPVDFVERGIGTAQRLLFSGEYDNYEYLIDTLIEQIPYVYHQCMDKKTGRVDVDTLKNLKAKLEVFIEEKDKHFLPDKLKGIVSKYFELLDRIV